MLLDQVIETKSEELQNYFHSSHDKKECMTDTRSRDVPNISGIFSIERASALTIVEVERSRFGRRSRRQIKCHEPASSAPSIESIRVFVIRPLCDLFQERASARWANDLSRSRFFWIRCGEKFLIIRFFCSFVPRNKMHLSLLFFPART